jgi:hypothetical protein
MSDRALLAQKVSPPTGAGYTSDLPGGRAVYRRTTEDLLLDALADTWELIVRGKGLRLAPPTLALHGGRSRLGLWMRAQRTISVSRDHALDDPWLDVAETLLHEVAHQLVDERMGGHDRPHGAKFQRALALLGALPDTAGAEPKVLAKVRKLLALASSPNQHEAELAMAKAQRLMIRHRIELAASEPSAQHVRRQLDVTRIRVPGWRKVLLSLVGRHFFVRALMMSAYLPRRQKWGTAFEIAGRPEDVEMAAYAYTFVADTAERLWKRHLAAHPGAGRSRQRFLRGVVMGFGTRLAANEEDARQEGLVWVGDPALDDLWQLRHPHIRTTRSRYVVDDHFDAGRSAGERVVLHRPVESTGSGGGLLEG